jgi:putative endonuclease
MLQRLSAYVRNALRTTARCLQASAYNPGVPYVYILRCGDGSLYTGVAKDLERRLEQHRAGQASRYTRSHPPVTLAWSLEVSSWSLALREERRIKNLSRVQKEEILSQESVRACPPPSS